jgi:hypothetical protein
MRKITLFAAAAALTLAGVAQAAPGRDVNLDGSTSPHRKPTLATAANHSLRRADTPPVKAAAVDVKAQADADIAAREARARGPRLEVHRQNLKGDEARRAIAQQANPNTIDRATANGDIEHTEQVTNLKVTLKK